MERNPPDWLNEDFLAEALQNEEGRHEKVTVTKFTAKPAAAAGDNYTSHMFRINVTYRVGSSGEKGEELILKSMINTGIMKDISDKFDAEPIVYNDILPRINKKLKTQIGPKSYYSSIGGAILLKDLKVDGYIVCDRFKLLDFAHCKLVYETLARYHAASVSLHHEDPELIEKLGTERHFLEDGEFTNVFKPWMNTCLKTFVGVIKERDADQTLIDFLQTEIGDIWDSMVRVCRAKPNTLNVLNHGDCWKNNMLFKYNSNQEIVDVKLIDFQLPRYNTPVLDLINFLWTSANEDVRKNQQKELFDVYLQTLNETLEELGCKERLTLERFEEDIKSSTGYLIWVVSFVRLFTFCEPELAVDMGKYNLEDFSSGLIDEKFRAIYDGKHYRDFLPGIIRDLQTWFWSRGLIERKL